MALAGEVPPVLLPGRARQKVRGQGGAFPVSRSVPASAASVSVATAGLPQLALFLDLRTVSGLGRRAFTFAGRVR